jgi:predicted GIY-YIG superfamily endonuclease
MLQCDDGYYYYGSTINDLRFRLHNHKCISTGNMNRPLYKHINNEWDKVKIILVEEFECLNRLELLRKENEYIRKVIDDKYCLNITRPTITNEERIEYNLKYNKEYENTHPEYKEWKKQYHRNYMREYRKSKKDINNNNNNVFTTRNDTQ